MSSHSAAHVNDAGDLEELWAVPRESEVLRKRSFSSAGLPYFLMLESQSKRGAR